MSWHRDNFLPYLVTGNIKSFPGQNRGSLTNNLMCKIVRSLAGRSSFCFPVSQSFTRFILAASGYSQVMFSIYLGNDFIISIKSFCFNVRNILGRAGLSWSSLAFHSLNASFNLWRTLILAVISGFSRY